MTHRRPKNQLVAETSLDISSPLSSPSSLSTFTYKQGAVKFEAGPFISLLVQDFLGLNISEPCSITCIFYHRAHAISESPNSSQCLSQVYMYFIEAFRPVALVWVKDSVIGNYELSFTQEERSVNRMDLTEILQLISLGSSNSMITKRHSFALLFFCPGRSLSASQATNCMCSLEQQISSFCIKKKTNLNQ